MNGPQVPPPFLPERRYKLPKPPVSQYAGAVAVIIAVACGIVALALAVGWIASFILQRQ